MRLILKTRDFGIDVFRAGLIQLALTFWAVTALGQGTVPPVLETPAEFPVAPAVAGRTYCVQFKDTVSASWSGGSILGCVVAEGTTATMQDRSLSGISQRFYRIIAQP